MSGHRRRSGRCLRGAEDQIVPCTESYKAIHFRGWRAGNAAVRVGHETD